MEIYIIVLLAFLSFTAGFIDSIAGGGGLILVPSLLLAGLPPQMALGTNKFGSIFGTAVALINFMRSGKVIWKIAGVGLAFSLVGSFIGTKAILLFDQKTAARIILLMLPFTAIITFLPRKQLKAALTDFSKWDVYLYTPLICAAIGFYDGFFGPGTGTFLIFAFYTFIGLHLVNASAIAKVFNLTSNVTSCITFAFAGKVWYSLGIILAVANLAGGYLGSVLALRRGQRFIRFFILLVFLLLFLTLLYRLWAS